MIVTEALSEGWLKKHALVVKVARLLSPPSIRHRLLFDGLSDSPRLAAVL